MNGLRTWERDAALPARAGQPELTPPPLEQAAELVRSRLLLPGAPELEQVRWTYARWKPAHAISAGYELRFADGATRWLHLKRYLGSKPGRLAGWPAEAGQHGAPDSLLRPGLVVPEQGLLAGVYPADRVLPGLPRLHDLRRMTRWINGSGLFGEQRMRAHRSRVESLRYRPERRAVVCLHVGLKAPDGSHGGSRLALRALPPGEAAGVAATRRACAGFGAAPRLLAVEERTGLLVEEWLDVEPHAPTEFGHAPLAGALLAELHGSGPPVGRSVGSLSSDALAPLFGWHERLARLAATVPVSVPGGRLVWSHGDFHPDQVALGRVDGAPRLLDLDRLGPAPAVVDLASWIADRLVADLGLPIDEAAEPLLEGYGEVPGGRSALSAAVAAELVHRAASALRRLERNAVERAEQVLTRATRLVAEQLA